MSTGLLWFDDDPKAPLEDKVRKAAAYYRKKFEKAATICLVHPSMHLGDSLVVDGITVRTWKPVAPNHFWIGEE